MHKLFLISPYYKIGNGKQLSSDIFSLGKPLKMLGQKKYILENGQITLQKDYIKI
jgi:hypothetical protein